MTTIIDGLVDRIRETAIGGHEPLVVFDLDGTLYNNAPRTLRILQEYSHLHARRFPELLSRIEQLPPGSLHYKVADTLKSIGVEDDKLIAEVIQFWLERFFTNDYVAHDLPLAGAVEFVRRIYEAGGIPVYLTGRDAPNMLVGTVRALQRDGFPVGTVDTRMILKDDFHRADDEYKASVVEHLRRLGSVVGVFDNEPGLCNLFKENFASALVCWLDTSHAPGAPALRDDVHKARDFSVMLPEAV